MRAELSECDIWYQQDIRVASLMVAMAEEGRRPSYEKAFVQLFGKHPNQITSWWGNRRILMADRFNIQEVNQHLESLGYQAVVRKGLVFASKHRC